MQAGQGQSPGRCKATEMVVKESNVISNATLPCSVLVPQIEAKEEMSNMLSILQSNHDDSCTNVSSPVSDPIISVSTCELPSVSCDVIQCSPKVGAAAATESSRNSKNSSEVATLQKGQILNKCQISDHPNFLCDLFQIEGRYFLDSYLQDELIGPIRGLLDTGSQDTILSYSYFQQVLEVTAKKPRLKSFDGSLISVDRHFAAHQYMENLHKHLQHAFAFAQKNLEKAAVSAKTYYDLKTTQKEYQTSDQVYLYNFALDQVKERKFLPSWKGPYVIIDKLLPAVYKIKIPKGDEFIEKWVHINQLRVCHPRLQLHQMEGLPDDEE
ncbi:uncharacterized protein LOC122943679 [Bufo gargarizans]|uniref:uncharacterized protein LOC122943679 n=1 Tax=Bufo gargarizans TaxID=30331 RepID=UPI001CF5EC2C|nr:uncharacterized protein LOC122943679 [Bufo gargarizans]